MNRSRTASTPPWLRSLAAALPLLAAGAGPAAGNEVSPAGIWQGALAVGGIELRLVLHIERAEDGALSGSLDSVDQGAMGIPIDTMSLTGEVFRFEIARILGSYEGRMDASGDRIEGTWTQSGMSLPLRFERAQAVPELERPQEPEPPYPYAEEEVTFQSAAEAAADAGAIRLAGTLTLPPGDGPHAAVVLVSGSGPQDRNETVFGHRPFLVLADFLTRRGIAVLRYDDRGVGGSGGSTARATTEDFADDALGAVRYLAGREEIDPRRIGLIGHSEGGLIAPMVAVRSDRVAFIVLIAGPGVPGRELLPVQAERLLRAQGIGEAEVESALEAQRRGFEILEGEPDDARATAALKTFALERFRQMSDEVRRALGGGDPAEMAELQAKQMVTPWMRFFLRHDPRPALRAARCPVLAINGEKDTQVDADQNLPEVLAALSAGQSADFTVMQLPGLNHLLQTADTGLPAEYARLEETMAPIALRAIGDWIAARIRD